MLIVKKSYDFSKWLLNHTGKFPKSYRFSVAVRLENTMLEFTDTLALVGRLLADPESLLHKATGWMLREVGKRDQPVLEAFLARHAPAMPRTALRYAIERLPEEQRKQYLKKS
ncbi:MAG: hypothetical protein HGB06_02295 [Chlorobaculum sp.]|jgi:3-methyladenine DNA glycosylase AlkD|nr:hypothetical protein [Chlorobaculum sp.]